MRPFLVTPAKAGVPANGRRTLKGWILAFAGMTMLAAALPAAAQDKTPPYWASIASGEAMMRTGPGKNYPGVWLYKRRDLPIRVVKLYPNWRLVEDPDGTRGWMLVTLLSDRRTAIVKPGEPRPIYTEASESSRLKYRAEPGVVGRIEHCKNGWCKFAVDKREGYIRTSDIWGVNDGEVVD
jgi:SH3-like domain-containing protein